MNRRGFFGLVLGVVAAPKEALRKALTPVARTRVAPQWLKDYCKLDVTGQIGFMMGRKMAMAVECQILYGLDDKDWKPIYERLVAEDKKLVGPAPPWWKV